MSDVAGENVEQVALTKLANIDPASLINELAKLRTAMRGAATVPDHDLATAAIAEAQIAVEKSDRTALLANLKKAGAWSLEVAEKIGVGVAIAALKVALGL
jgi:hypothetical protein